jgi:hypothetical protein
VQQVNVDLQDLLALQANKVQLALRVRLVSAVQLVQLVNKV